MRMLHKKLFQLPFFLLQASAVRKDLPDLASLHLPDFNLDSPGLVVDLIDKLVPESNITEITLPDTVTQSVPGGGGGGAGGGNTVPYIGDLSGLGPNSK